MIRRIFLLFSEIFFKKKTSKVEQAQPSPVVRYSLEHFRKALMDLRHLHYDDFHEIPYLHTAGRIYLTAGVAIRFASKQERCSWTEWKLESFSASPSASEEIGDEFRTAKLLIKSRSGKLIEITYKESGRHGDAYLENKILFGWNS